MQVSQRNILILIIFNLIILLELCFCLAQASKDPENVVIVFLKYFLFLIIPTFIIGRFVVKRLITQGEPISQEVKISPFKEEQRIWYSQLTEKEESLTEPLQIPITIKKIAKKKIFLERLTILFFVTFIVSFFDGCVNKLLHPPNLLNLLPGQSVKVNAPLEKKISGVHELTYISTSEDIKLEFQEIYSGFWLGGTEWRGILSVTPNIKPGQYQVIIQIKEFESKRPFVFIVRIHESIEHLKKSSMSLIKKTIGVSPWIVFITSGFFIVLTVLSILKFSNKIEAIMKAEGQAEVFYIRKGEFITEIGFGLGSKNNLKPGDVLNLYTDKGQPVGAVLVQHTAEEYSIGIVKTESNVKPGFIVALKK